MRPISSNSATSSGSSPNGLPSAIAVFYRKRILGLVLGTLGREPETLEYVAKLAVATLPAVVIGLTAKDQ